MAATTHQVRGMLLEEAVLFLLRASGYDTVDEAGSDPTLHAGRAGLEVRGRGSFHQIDAIADFRPTQPFGHPQRLLVEAKFQTPRVRLPVLRNALGTLMDLGQFWNGPGYQTLSTRYHYQYAVFSASGFTSPAEEFAFVQDIFLVPLNRSAFLTPLLRAIGVAVDGMERAGELPSGTGSLARLRMLVREEMRNGTERSQYGSAQVRERLGQVCVECRRIGGAVVAMLGGHFPVFLVPDPAVHLRNLDSVYEVRIRYRDRRWYIDGPSGALFSFDLPLEIYKRYASEDESARLNRTSVYEIKDRYMREIVALVVSKDHLPRPILLRLSDSWMQEVRPHVERAAREPPIHVPVDSEPEVDEAQNQEED